MKRWKVVFVCVHNSCRSQMAEALGRKYLSDICQCYSAGTEIKPQINPDAVRLMKQVYSIDMEADQYPKLLSQVPQGDVIISMGCNVTCPYLPGALHLNWGLEDPSGKGDEVFLRVMGEIEEKVLALRDTLLAMRE